MRGFLIKLAYTHINKLTTFVFWNWSGMQTSYSWKGKRRDKRGSLHFVFMFTQHHNTTSQPLFCDLVE